MNVVRHAQLTNVIDQMRDPQRRSWILLNPTSIGDTAIICAFARDFVAHHGHSITMVVPPDHLPITRLYPGRFTRVLTAERTVMMELTHGVIDPLRFELDQPFVAHPYDHGDGRSDNFWNLFKFPGRGGVSMSDLYRYMLRLPWSARMERPSVPDEWAAEAEELARHAGIIPGASVIIFPATSTGLPQFPDIVWATLAARLTERGYTVFCNTKGGVYRPQTMPIPGTRPIEIPLHLALPLVRIAGRIVSPPNGLQFLTMLGGCFDHMTVLAPVMSSLDDYQSNGRTYSVTTGLAQYMQPEMCVDLGFSEYYVPHDAEHEDLRRRAVAIADNLTESPGHVVRKGSAGAPFVEEHRDWLSMLVDPVRRH